MLLLALAGCNNADDTTIDESASQQLIFSASLPDDEDTRMAFANETSPTLIWSEGDEIRIFSYFDSELSLGNKYGEMPKEPSEGDITTEQTTSTCKFIRADNCGIYGNLVSPYTDATFNGGNVSDWLRGDSGNYSNNISNGEGGLRFYAIYSKKNSDCKPENGDDTSTNREIAVSIPNKQSGDLSSQICVAERPIELYDEMLQGYMNGSSSLNEVMEGYDSFEFEPVTALIRLRLKLDANYADEELTLSKLNIIPTSNYISLYGEYTLNLEDKTITWQSGGNGASIALKDANENDISITINKTEYTDVYFSVGTTSEETRINIGTTNGYSFYKEGETYARPSFIISGGIESGTRYTVKRIVKKVSA